MFPLVQAVYELNDLLARAEKAETVLSIREALLAQMQSALHATYAETHHPDIGSAERKPMMPHERIEWLGKDRDNWEARAKAAEAERNDLMRKLSEARVKEDWQRVRIDAAIAALEGMLACRGGGDATERAKVATEYADALVAELNKGV